MGWGSCGKNSRTGQWMGYWHPSKCHKRGCGKDIDRGLSYVCGGMHEGGENGCGYYFCESHLRIVRIDGESTQICEKCLRWFENSEDHTQDEDWNFTTREGEAPQIRHAGGAPLPNGGTCTQERGVNTSPKTLPSVPYQEGERR